MDEIEELKRTLGPAAKEYNRAQLYQIQSQLSAMAELLLDLYFAKKKDGLKNHRAPSFDTDERRP
jgi:hypothetical protein